MNNKKKMWEAELMRQLKSYADFRDEPWTSN